MLWSFILLFLSKFVRSTYILFIDFAFINKVLNNLINKVSMNCYFLFWDLIISLIRRFTVFSEVFSLTVWVETLQAYLSWNLFTRLFMLNLNNSRPDILVILLLWLFSAIKVIPFKFPALKNFTYMINLILGLLYFFLLSLKINNFMIGQKISVHSNASTFLVSINLLFK